MERAELFGDVGLRDGSTVFEPGIILQGMQRPGAVILLDEISNMRPDFAASLHPVLEPGGSYRVTRTGEVFRPAPGVVWFAADNSMGGGDYTGQFAGLKQLNGATRSRFIKCAFTYLPESAEAKLVAGRTGTPFAFCRQLIDFVGKTRVASTVGEIELPPTLRQVIPMAGMIRDGIEPRTALAACVLADQSPQGAEKVQQLWAANVDEAKLLAALAPKSKAAAAVVAEESAADALRREVQAQA
jgi:MoxR-like ATPase